MKILIGLFLILFSLEAFAQGENPLRRTCRLNGGALFWGLEIEEPQKDQIGFCNYGNSLMGAHSLLDYFYHGKLSQATKAYLDTRQRSFYSCRDAGAKRIEAKSLNKDEIWLVCYFSEDYSFVLETTLVEGWNADFNQALTQAMKPTN